MPVNNFPPPSKLLPRASFFCRRQSLPSASLPPQISSSHAAACVWWIPGESRPFCYSPSSSSPPCWAWRARPRRRGRHRGSSRGRASSRTPPSTRGPSPPWRAWCRSYPQGRAPGAPATSARRRWRRLRPSSPPRKAVHDEHVDR